MMTKSTLPKLWLYISLLMALSLIACVSCTQAADDAQSKDTTAVDVHQNEISEYNITYTPGSYAEGAIHTVKKRASESVTLDFTDISRDGFTLVGWQENEGADTYYPIGYEFTENRALTLTPVWEINTYEVVLSPGENGIGSSVKASKIHATPFTLPSQVFTREGYTQTGWSIVDGGVQVLPLDGTYVDDKPITLYPVWKINTYTVKITAGESAQGDEQVVTVAYGGKFTLPEAIYSKTDYDLIGWATEDGGSVKYQLSQQITIKSDLTLYPVWELTKTYDITPDYKKLPKTLITTMNVSDLALYYKLVNAYMSYGKSVSFTTDTDPYRVLELLQCYFPVMYADTDEYGPWINYTDNTVNFGYSSVSKEEHDARIAKFTKALEKYLSGFNRTDTDAERALLIYSRLLENMTYDNELDKYPYDADMMMQSGYYAIMAGTGRSDTFARAYAFLLTQADVDAVTVSSPVDGADTDHYWVALVLDSKWYYADVSLDLAGKTFTHFGMTDVEMSVRGYKEARNDVISAYIESDIKELIDTLDTRFHAFHAGAYTPVLDRELDKVFFKDVLGNDIVFDILAKAN